MLKFGIITGVDQSKGLARVTFNDELGPDNEPLVSNWLPINSAKTLNDKYSIFFDTNEHVWCLMDDNLEFGVIGGAIYSTKDLPNGATAGGMHITFDNGLFIDYNRSSRLLTVGGSGDVKIDLPTGNLDIICAAATITATTEVSITAPVVSMSGLLNVAGVVTAGGIAAAAGTGGSGNVTIEGDVEITGDATAGGVSLINHVHSGVQTGGGVTGPAQ